MRLLVDAVAVQAGSSAVVVEHLLHGWRAAYPDDRLTVLTGPDGPPFALPVDVALETARPPFAGAAGRLWLRAAAVRRAARATGADAVLSTVPASGLLGTRPPRGVLLYDLRHELLPHQFTRAQRLARRVSWGWSMARADRVLTISERTLDDLQRRHPRLAPKGVAAQLGSDHVTDWPGTGSAGTAAPYALAFGHFANKNARAVVEGWARFCASDDRWRLRLVGMSTADRSAAAALVDRLGIGDRVELMPWLDDASFRQLFTAADLVVFPSEFEGFGLPAVEAMRLGIPVVVSHDPALAEVTGGHATVARSPGAGDLAAAITTAVHTPADQLAAGQRHAATFRWARTASTVRASLADGDAPA